MSVAKHLRDPSVHAVKAARPRSDGPVVHVIAPSRAGGAESVVAALTTAAKATTQAVILNQVAGPDDPPHPFVQQLRERGVVVEEVRCGRRQYRAEVRALTRRLQDAGAGLVHTHGYHGSWVGYFAARRVSTPVVATVHGYINRNVKERIYNVLERWLLRRFDAVIAVSPGIRDELMQSGLKPDCVHLVQNGLAAPARLLDRDQARRRLGLATDTRVVGWIGRLSPEKGPDLFLQAVAGNDFPGRAVLVGDGPEEARLTELARALSLDAADRVTFAGYQPDAAGLLPAFDVLALTSRTEGTPMVILEAVAAGVPIVAFETGGIPHLLRPESAWLVPPEDVTALRAAIRAALTSPTEGNRRARVAREDLADRLDVHRWLERIQDVYRQAADR